MIDAKLLTRFNRVALAVSGGKDSMALLYDVARQFSHDFFYVINIEHGIRGEESRDDSAFVEDYAKSIGVEVKRFDVDAVGYSHMHGYTLEQGARLLRREIFKGEVESGCADRVVVAHHLDDNVESILMHIFRGSGMRGIKGMDSDDGVLLRPLLGVSRASIDDFIRDNNIPYREDSTNSDVAYRRNFIRHDIMPLLRDRYPAIDRSIMRLAESAREDEQYLNSLVDGYMRRDGDRVLVDINAPDVLFKRAVYRAFTMLGVVADVEERHYNLLLELRHMASGTSLDMPYGVEATLEYDNIALYRPTKANYYSESVTLGDIYAGDYIVNIARCDEMTRSDGGEYRTLYVDGTKVDNATIRPRESGDVFRRYKGGTKKLKDYLIDIKVPRTRRDMPIFAVDNNVLVVAGYEIADEVKVDDNTTKIYRIQLRRK